MKHLLSISLSFSFLISALMNPILTVAEDCTTVINIDEKIINQELFEFTFFLDENSMTENGWSLECEIEGLIWNVPPGSMRQSMKYLQRTTTTDTTTGSNGRTTTATATTASGNKNDKESFFVKEQACLPKDATCHFTLEDTHGDGLLIPGYYYLTLGANTIAVSEKGEEFYEKAYCFGPQCPVLSQEESEACDNLYVWFEADNHPEESSLSIQCNDGTILINQKDFEFTTLTASTFTTANTSSSTRVMEFDQCLPATNRSQCCTLNVYDTAGNGLDVLEGGNIFVEWRNSVIFQYHDDGTSQLNNHDGSGSSNASYPFGTIRLDFGPGCPNGEENGYTNPSISLERPFLPQGQKQTFKGSPTLPKMIDDGSISRPTIKHADSGIANDSLHWSEKNEDTISHTTGAIIGLVIGTLLLLAIIVLFIARRAYSKSISTSLKGNKRNHRHRHDTVSARMEKALEKQCVATISDTEESKE